jgi:uncharacterized protein (TIGR03083 family)
MMDVISADRRELAAVLGGLSDAQWHAPSLCDGWTVAQVVAHLTMPFRISAEEFARGMQQARGQFTEYSDAVASRDSQLPHAELVAALRDNADTPWKPPGGGFEGALSHDIIHGLDIAWPLSIRYPIANQAMSIVLDMVVGHGGHSVFDVDLDGVRLRATDLDWSSGTGPAVAGPCRALLLLAAGRKIPDEVFTGPGTQLLAAAAR